MPPALHRRRQAEQKECGAEQIEDGAAVNLGTFESYPLFFLLLGLYLVLRQRPALGGIAAGIGFQIKLFPLLVVPVAWHALSNYRHRLTYLLTAAATVAIVSVPFWLINRTLLIASFQAMLARSSWETVWALLDGYYSFGKVASIGDRFVPETALWQSHPSALPWLGIEAGFLLLYALIWTRRFNWGSASSLVALAGLTVNLALLGSKGYSTQFLVYVLPFVILLLPNIEGAVYIVLLSVFDFAEGVLYFIFFPDQHWLLAVTVLGRTALWLLLCLEYFVVLIPGLRPRRDRLRAVCTLPAIGFAIAVSLGSLAALPLLLAPATAEYGAAARFIRQQDAKDQAVVLVDHDTFYAARRYLPGAAFWLPTAKTNGSLDQIEADLAEFARGHRQVWLLVDHKRGETLPAASIRYWLDWNASPLAAPWFEALELRGYQFPATGDPSLRVGHRLHAAFGTLELIGYDTVASGFAVGEPFRLILYWRAAAPAAADYQTFVHLVNPVYRSFGTGDRPLLDEEGRPPSRWAPGQVVRQAYELKAAAGTPPGSYALEIGLYDAAGGARLTLRDRPDANAPSDRVLIPGVELRHSAAPQPDMQQRLGANFGGQAWLVGYDIAGQRTPGGKLSVTLYWRPMRRIQDDYVVFVHLVDKEGRIRAQQDAGPADAYYPTSRWQTAALVRDTHDLALPRDPPPDGYQLRVGLYLPNNGPRLGVQDDAGRTLADYVDLGPVLVPVQ